MLLAFIASVLVPPPVSGADGAFASMAASVPRIRSRRIRSSQSRSTR